MGTDQFDTAIRKLPNLLKELQHARPIDRTDLVSLPPAGIYALYEDGKPIYVGRSRRLRNRLREHGQRSSDRYSATFAFRLALEEAQQQGLQFLSKRRADIEQDARFKPLFLAAKERICNMQIRAIEVTDPIEQTLLEVYAALTLETPYNDFNTH